MPLTADGAESLVLLALLPHKKPWSLRDLVKPKTFTELLSGGAKGAFEAARAAAQRLTEGGFVEVAGKKGEKLMLTPSGAARARGFLGAKKLGPALAWDRGPAPSLYRSHLPAKALGLVDRLDAAGLRRLSQVDGLRAEILRQRFQLELRPVPDIKVVRSEVAWRLLEDGASREAIGSARKRGKSFVSAPLVADVLMFSKAQCATVKPNAGHAALAAVLVGLDASELGAAALYRTVALQVLAGVPASGETARPAARASQGRAPAAASSKKGAAPGDFVARALQAAQASETGRVGESLVLISHAWRALHARDEALSLSDFKQRLLEAYRSDRVVLAKADMPQTLDPRDLEASQIVDRDATFAFIRL